jgi:hypothetical protein
MVVRSETSGSALDLLEREDLELRRLFSLLRQHRGTSVEDRADYGQAAKDVIRHIATREAALVEVAASLAGRPGLERVSAQMQDSFGTRRRHIDRVEKMSRGVQGINLNVGQDFDSEMQELEASSARKSNGSWETPFLRSSTPWATSRVSTTR